ncbi:MAG: O-antigen ligase family protein [Pleurocapsa sp. MO_192.B19]|nr:O-antigen ligase family protein [Pleurocapsa sp. MO_192.B19]
MKINFSWYVSSRLSFWVGIIAAGVGLFLGILAGTQPLLLCLAISAIILVIYFCTNFEQAVLGLLIIRSSLDVFSTQQVPAMFAVGLDGLAILYVTLRLLIGKKVQTDLFWWFFAIWVGLQGFWVVLIPLGRLDPLYLSESIPEWVRLFSWLMVYLLVMQLKGKVHPIKIINTLFLSLVAPITAALLQIVLPAHLLPSLLAYRAQAFTSIEEAARINGTLGHPNAFATFILLFIGLTCWKLEQSKHRRLWLVLLGILIFLITSTKALVGLVMTGVFMIALVAPRLTLSKLISGIVLMVAVIGLFAATEFGQERLASLTNTPLLNPDLDIYQAILLKHSGQVNSFNWRLNQWVSLLKVWREAPVLGHGMGTDTFLGDVRAAAHNDYIRFLVEEGIVGFTTFIAFLGANYWRLIRVWFVADKRSPQRNLCLVMIAILIAINVGMLTDNIWSNTTFFYYWLTVLGIVSWDWKEIITLENEKQNNHFETEKYSQ